MGLAEDKLLVRNASAEQRSTSNNGAYLELSNIIPMTVSEAITYETKMITDSGVMPCNKRNKVIKTFLLLLLVAKRPNDDMKK